MAEVSMYMYNSDMLIFVDETGYNHRSGCRETVWLFNPWASSTNFQTCIERNTIFSMTTTQLIDCYVVTGSVDGDVFYNFIQPSLLPQLQPFNG